MNELKNLVICVLACLLAVMVTAFFTIPNQPATIAIPRNECCDLCRQNWRIQAQINEQLSRKIGAPIGAPLIGSPPPKSR